MLIEACLGKLDFMGAIDIYDVLEMDDMIFCLFVD